MAYTVVGGDTLGKLAARWGTTVEAIMKANPLIKSADVIRIGWVLTNPAEKAGTTTGTAPAPQSPATGTTPKDPTKGTQAGQTLKNVPGTPEVWKVGKSTYLAYLVPGTNADPVYMTWYAPTTADVQSWFGPDQKIIYNREMSWEQYRSMGALDFGSTDEIPPGADNPFSSWKATLAVQAQTQPWIRDDDYQTLIAMALVEGRELTEAEIATTDWWQNHTAGERAWMIMFHGDPSTAQERLSEGRASVEETIRQAGGGNTVDQKVIDYMADQVTMGHWTQNYLTLQIRALTDPFSATPLDAGLAKLNVSTVGTTASSEDTVRNLLSTWLGPAFGEWDAAEVSRIAGDFRNDPDAEAAFVEQLKDQRMALLPEYTDRNMSYGAIANTWRQWWLGQWGEQPDEKDPLFLTVLRNNDIDESARLLRREGLSRGVGKVISDLSSQTVNMGDSERRPILNG